MNEIQTSQQLSELELLQRTQPNWKLAPVEPFSRSAQQDVVPPNWDKQGFRDTNGTVTSSQTGGGGGGANIEAVMGVKQTDGSFAIKLVSFAGVASDP